MTPSDASTSPSHGLTRSQMATLRAVLRPYAGDITSVGLFGSRATGNFRPQSDIDLVLYGAISEEDTDRLRTLFAESLLPVSVDVVAYRYITYEPFKRHIDAVMQPLFSSKDLQGG